MVFLPRQRSSSGLCFDHRALVFVGPAAGGRSLFPAVRSSDVNQRVPCPDPVQHTCGVMNGSFAWLKVPGRTERPSCILRLVEFVPES